MQNDALNCLASLKRPVMITGHTGFKGAWLSLLLNSQGIEVVGLSLPPEDSSLYSMLKTQRNSVEHFVDIRDFESTKKVVESVRPSLVFHLAAQPLVLESYKHPLETFQTNVMGTANLLQSISGLKEKTQVVCVTTDKVYENLETGRKFVESDKLKGRDPYSASKVGTESVITAWRNMWRQSNSHALASVRAGNVIAGGDLADNRLIPDIIRGIKSKKRVAIRRPESTRPWQHVLDPLFGYLQVAKHLINDNSIESFNFGPTEESLKVRTVVEKASKVFGQQFEYEFVSSEKDNYESGLLDLDSSLAHAHLEWKPRWNQEEAIEKTLHWWQIVLNETSSPDEACRENIREFLGNS